MGLLVERDLVDQRLPLQRERLQILLRSYAWRGAGHDQASDEIGQRLTDGSLEVEADHLQDRQGLRGDWGRMTSIIARACPGSLWLLASRSAI